MTQKNQRPVWISSIILASGLLLNGCGSTESTGTWTDTVEISAGSGNRLPKTAVNSTSRLAIWEKVTYTTTADTATNNLHTDPGTGDHVNLSFQTLPDQLEHTHYITTAHTSVWAALGNPRSSSNVTDWKEPVKLAQGQTRNLSTKAIAKDDGDHLWADTLSKTEFTQAQIGIDSSNRGLAIWVMRDSNEQPAIYASRYDGSNWGSSSIISNTTKSVRNPRLAMETSGNAIAIWEQMNETCQCFTLVARLFKPNAGGWEASSSITLLSDDGTGTPNSKPATVTNAQVAYSSNGIGMVSWNQLEPDASPATAAARTIYAHPLLISGWTGTPVAVSSTTALAENMSLSMNNNGEAILAWEQWDSIAVPAQKSVYAASYSSGAWAAAALTHPGQATLDTREVTTALDDNSNAYVAWTIQDTSGGLTNKWNNADSQLWMATNSSGAWVASLQISNERFAIHKPQLMAMATPTLILTWREWSIPTSKSAYSVYGRVIDSSDNSSSATELLGTASSDEQGSLQMSASDKHLNLVWSENENSIQSVEFRR